MPDGERAKTLGGTHLERLTLTPLSELIIEDFDVSWSQETGTVVCWIDVSERQESYGVRVTARYDWAEHGVLEGFAVGSVALPQGHVLRRLLAGSQMLERRCAKALQEAQADAIAARYE